jgi:diguanylate cyclase (GGDEF)-like protein/PAS domain S-box-containing protein
MADVSLASLYDAMHALERVLGPFPILTLAVDRQGRMVMSNVTARDTFGLSEVLMLEKTLDDLVPGLEVTLTTGADGKAQAKIKRGKGKAAGSRARRARRFNDKGREIGVFPVEAHVSALPMGDDAVVFVALHDLSEKLRSDRALRQSQELLEAVLSGVPALISAKGPDGRYQLVNGFAAEVFGIDTEAAVGKTSTEVFGASTGRAFDAVDRAFLSGRATSRNFEETLVDSEGRKRRFVTTKGALRESDGTLRSVLSVSLDVSHQDAAEQRLDRLAQHDDLTGLPRRPALRRALITQIEKARDKKTRVGLLVVGVESLGRITAEHGQAARDAVLRRLAIRLSGLVDENAVVAMTETDGFSIALPSTDDPEAIRQAMAALLERLAEPVSVGKNAVLPKFESGLAVWPESGLDADDLMRAADDARRLARTKASEADDAKSPGKRGFRDRVRVRREAETALRRDLEHDRLKVRFAPIRNLASDRLVGFRAMLFGADGKPLADAPSDGVAALSIAEQNGLVAPIGEWLFRRACMARGNWRMFETGGPPGDLADIPIVAIALHTQQLYQPDLAEMISDILSETGTPANALRLGVTEAAAMDDPELAGNTLAALAEIGVGLSLERFGIGPASLLHLRNLPVTSVSLAPEITAGIPNDPDAVAITSGALALLRALDKRPAAAGITTAEQLRFLRESECEEAWGPVVGAPLDPDEAAALISGGLKLAV